MPWVLEGQLLKGRENNFGHGSIKRGSKLQREQASIKKGSKTNNNGNKKTNSWR